MERLFERVKVAEKALEALHELIVIQTPTTIERDATIQRFEFSFETCWKTAKQFLYDIEGLDIGSPKGVIRSLREIGGCSEEETILGLRMVDHRNLTVHTYNEALAIEIFTQVPIYYELLRNWIDLIQNKIQKSI